MQIVTLKTDSFSTTGPYKIQKAIWHFNFLVSKPRDTVIPNLKKK